MKWSELRNRLPGALRQRPLLSAAVGIGLVVLLLAAVYWVAPRSSDASTAFHEVRRGDFTVTILDRGTLTAVSEVSIRNEVEGTSRVIYIVPEGTFVTKGDLLVELDSSQAQDQWNQQQIAYEKATFALAQAEAQLDILKSATNSDIRAAQLKVTFAKLDLDKFNDPQGQAMVDLVEASNKVVQAQAQLAVNQQNYHWTTNLANLGFETKQRVDADRLAVLNNENSVIVATNSLLMLERFDLRKQRQKLLSDWEEAEKELERVIAQSERKIAQAQADLVSQSNTLALQEKKLLRDRKNLDATKLYAKQDGLVVYAMSENRFSSESLIEEGAVVRNRQELIKLPDTSRMKVIIKVHESHVGLVQVGQPAFVKLDSVPDQRFQGVVDKVALLPDSQARFGNPNLKVYNTEIIITDPLPEVKPGVSAQAEIIVTNITDSLSVPLQAVTTLKGRQVVYAQQGGKTMPVPVQVGMFNTRFIEVLSGLKEGDRVLLSPPFDTQERDLEGAVLAADEKAKAATNAPARPRASTPVARADKLNGTDAQPGAPRDAPDLADNRRPAGANGPAAELAATRPPGGEGRPPGGPPGFNREEMMKQFDTNGDGELDESEREAMRTALQARFGAQGDRSGNRGGDRAQRPPRGERRQGSGEATDPSPAPAQSE